MTCPACQAPCGEQDVFCEACGESLARACAQCGGAVAPDGYCQQCGAPAASRRDHWSERPAPWLGGCCDRGIRHERNEDAMSLAIAGATGGEGQQLGVIVVCDGVSSSTDPDAGALAAARAACDVLVEPAPKEETDEQRMVEAAAAAQRAIAALGKPPNPAACTYVAATIRDRCGEHPGVTVGWVGDSRAYWLPDAGTGEEPAQLTTDDSWAAVRIEMGVPREQAETGPQAHAITRWLGADSNDHAARYLTLTPKVPGWLLLCSDGLWNYSSPADQLAAVVRKALSDQQDEPQAASEQLVRWANEQGGQDNITVVLARIEPADPPPAD